MKTNNQNKSEPQQSSEDGDYLSKNQKSFEEIRDENIKQTESIWDNYKAPDLKEKAENWAEKVIKELVEEKKNPGLFEQIRQSNVNSYNAITPEILQETLNELFKK